MEGEGRRRERRKKGEGRREKGEGGKEERILTKYGKYISLKV